METIEITQECVPYITIYISIPIFFNFKNSENFNFSQNIFLCSTDFEKSLQDLIISQKFYSLTKTCRTHSTFYPCFQFLFFEIFFFFSWKFIDPQVMYDPNLIVYFSWLCNTPPPPYQSWQKRIFWVKKLQEFTDEESCDTILLSNERMKFFLKLEDFHMIYMNENWKFLKNQNELLFLTLSNESTNVIARKLIQNSL